jgi:GNAT superfamily N-acetyltransferase
MTTNLIREWLSIDIPSIAAIMADHPLWQHYGVTESSAQHRLTILWQDQERGFVSMSGNGFVEGFVLYNTQTFGNNGYIRLFGVAQNLTSKGTGAKLLSAVEDRLREDGIDRLVLLCTEWNGRARQFYVRQGFFEVGILPNWVIEGTHEVMYAKTLH